MTTQDLLLSCHCQRNVLSLTIPSLESTDIASLFPKAMVCDCSHCSKRRLIWHFTTLSNLKVMKGCEQGRGDLKGYKFGSQKLEHQFCPTCGTHLLGGASIESEEKSASVGVNLRCVRFPTLDVWSLKPASFPGRAHGEAYTEPDLPPGAREYFAERAKHYDFSTQVYAGSCHCKAITFGVLSQTLDEAMVVDCSCSICRGNGILWIYPGRYDIYVQPSEPSQPWQPPADLVRRYRFPGTKRRHDHVSCVTCGCEVFNVVELPEVDESGARFEGWREDNGKGEGMFGVNAALLIGAEQLMRHGKGEEEIKEGLKGYRRVNGATDWGEKYEVKL